MSTALTTRIRSHPPRISRRAGVIAAVGGGVATAAVAVALGSSGDAPAPVAPPAPPAASATGLNLSRSELASVQAAMASGDARLERLAADVAAGRAGPSALADPGILRHYGVDTSAAPPARYRVRAAADTFHHR